jgi:hypothetical protein
MWLKICAALLLGLSMTAKAQPISVGRAQITLPPGQWVDLKSNDSEMKYSGDMTGSIKGQVRAWGFVNEQGVLQAIVQVHSSDAVVNSATMQWSKGCKPQNSEYIHDGTKGSLTALNCLRVWRSVKAENWLQKRDPQMLESIKSKNLQAMQESFQILQEIGYSNGSFLFTRALISHEVLKNYALSAEGTRYAGQPGVAWGHELANAAQKSILSWGGGFEIPKL